MGWQKVPATAFLCSRSMSTIESCRLTFRVQEQQRILRKGQQQQFYWPNLLHPDAPWCWIIYLHLPQQFASFVGKYSSTMEHLGHRMGPRERFAGAECWMPTASLKNLWPAEAKFSRRRSLRIARTEDLPPSSSILMLQLWPQKPIINDEITDSFDGMISDLKILKTGMTRASFNINHQRATHWSSPLQTIHQPFPLSKTRASTQFTSRDPTSRRECGWNDPQIPPIDHYFRPFPYLDEINHGSHRQIWLFLHHSGEGTYGNRYRMCQPSSRGKKTLDRFEDGRYNPPTTLFSANIYNTGQYLPEFNQSKHEGRSYIDSIQQICLWFCDEWLKPKYMRTR